MRLELKKAILDWIIENINEFQIVIACHDAFREYIYNKEGNYLIGGEKVSKFIEEAIKLIKGEM
jgi:hypothetical protein